jgi:hypothetical protein
VTARAVPPSSPARSDSVSGPREFANATSWPASTKSRPAVAPILPLPMIPIRMSLTSRLALLWRGAGRAGRGLAGDGVPLRELVDVLRHLAGVLAADAIRSAVPAASFLIHPASW